jgi:hypothetical protein
MNAGTRHPSAPRRGLSAFASMSVIALLALACFPVFAQADSSGVQYSDDLPRAEGENTPTRKKEPTAKSSAEDDGGSSKTPGDSKKSMEGDDEGGSSESGGVPVGGDKGDRGQGSPGGSANTKDNALVQPGGQAKGTTASEESDGGSSLLVPILIAILALAAISVAAVMIRQRRQRGGTAGTAPSPKAS